MTLIFDNLIMEQQTQSLEDREYNRVFTKSLDQVMAGHKSQAEHDAVVETLMNDRRLSVQRVIEKSKLTF